MNLYFLKQAGKNNQMIKVTATPNNQILKSESILWEITWQCDVEPPQGQVVMLPPKGWTDPLLKKVIPNDVVEALIKKYDLQS